MFWDLRSKGWGRGTPELLPERLEQGYPRLVLTSRGNKFTIEEEFPNIIGKIVKMTILWGFLNTSQAFVIFRPSANGFANWFLYFSEQWAIYIKCWLSSIILPIYRQFSLSPKFEIIFNANSIIFSWSMIILFMFLIILWDANSFHRKILCICLRAAKKAKFRNNY